MEDLRMWAFVGGFASGVAVTILIHAAYEWLYDFLISWPFQQ